MKRFFAITLTMLMLLPVVAQAEVILYRKEEAGIVRGMWMENGALHLLTSTDVCIWPGGNAAIEVHALDMPLPEGESPLAFAPRDGGMWVITADAEANAQLRSVTFRVDGKTLIGEGEVFDWRAMLDAETLQMRSPIVTEETLAFAALDESGLGSLALYDRATGEGRVIREDADGNLIDVRMISSYQDGKLLVASAVQGAQSSVMFYEVDPSAPVPRFLCLISANDSRSVGGLVYDADAGRIVFALDGAIFRMDLSGSEPAEVLSDRNSINTMTDTYGALMDDGTYVLADWNSAIAYNTPE